MPRTLYDVLMLSPEADREVITLVYRHLAKRLHPDRDPTPQAAARMAELNEAYAVLSDPTRRASYDNSVAMVPGPALRPGSGAIGGDGRPARAGAVNAAPPAGHYGEAGQPPSSPPPEGRPLSFGRYRGWTLNQVARRDRDYLEWLSRTTMGRSYRQELEALLRQR